jgi:hypothetical protein
VIEAQDFEAPTERDSEARKRSWVAQMTPCIGVVNSEGALASRTVGQDRRGIAYTPWRMVLGWGSEGHYRGFLWGNTNACWRS